MWNPRTYYCECSSACKIDEYLEIKNCSCEEQLIPKLVLEPEDEILNTTQSLLDNKKVARQKSNCFINAVSLIVICTLLLAVASISCYCYYTRFRKKQKS